MIILGIESTAHTFGCGIVKDEEILANEKKLFTTEEGGMIPAELADHHVECCKEIITNAINKAGITIKDVDGIAYSASPGIGNALRIGTLCAKSLGFIHNKPLLPVNHCIAHLEIGKKETGLKDPVLLYASGANTQIIAFEGGRYRIFGETLDMGVGNFLDALAREMGFGFPGGPKIEKTGEGGEYIELPYTVKGMDVSFGGLFTNIKQKLEKGFTKEDLCYSLQETAFAMLVEVSERAMAHCRKTELVLGGGVGCNKRLQEMCQKMCSDRGGTFGVPANQYLVDNAAMIAYTGLLQLTAGRSINAIDATCNPYLRTDDVEVFWK